jgi:adenine C2-methylase RlmN of 23S rRNA A2503 and tRNA A37
VSSLVAEDDASAEIALLETQDGDYIELVQWMHRGKTIFPQLDKANVVGLGQAHLCLNVRNIEKVIETALLSDMARLISKEITVVTSGPNVGAKVAFLEVGTFLYLELFERTSI